MAFIIRKLKDLRSVVFDLSTSMIISDKYENIEIIPPTRSERVINANFLIAIKNLDNKVILCYNKDENRFIEISKNYKNIYYSGFLSLQSKFGFAQNHEGLFEILYYDPIRMKIKVLGTYHGVYPIGLINNASDFVVVKKMNESKKIVQNILIFERKDISLKQIGFDYKKVYLHGLIDGTSMFCVVELLTNQFALHYFYEDGMTIEQLSRKFDYIDEDYQINDSEIIYKAKDRGVDYFIIYDMIKNVIFYRKK